MLCRLPVSFAQYYFNNPPLPPKILIDGVDIKDVNLDYIRSQIAVVSQEPHLFSRSIAKNITYGVEDASQAQIEEAARQANAYDFCVGFEEGFATEVGEFGSQLSGGQVRA